jgi:hypothetical protein
MGWPDGKAQSRVAVLMGELSEESFHSRRYRRTSVSRSALADAVRSYYALPGSCHHGFYTASVNGQSHPTSILTTPAWLNVHYKLSPERENFTLGTDSLPKAALSVDDATAHQALTRLAETLTFGTRLVNAPTYRILDVDIASARLAGRLGIVNFIEYALTFDLLEGELADAVADGRPGREGLPLRSRYLPDSAALTDLGRRLCVGGPAALTAIARNHGGRHDYVLLVQERSGHVLNAARRLAVIPKAFHQPLIDLCDDSNLAMTIEREMEEELFGRPEFDLDGKAQRCADPMRSDLLSQPMRWLADRRQDGVWHAECTAFGINAVSGNFECASLIVINDERWWDLYGGHIEANWEVEGLRRYSTLAPSVIESLVADPNWSNEGLFAFVEGIRRLSELDSERVALHGLKVELQR